MNEDARNASQFQVPDEGVYTAVISIAVSNDGRFLACGSKDRTVRIWDLNSKQLLTTLRGHTAFVTKVKFLAEGNQILTSSNDGTIRRWEVQSGRLLDVYSGHDDAIVGLYVKRSDFHCEHSANTRSEPQVDFYSLGLDQSIRSWSVNSHQQATTTTNLNIEGTYTTVWHPDEKRIFVACYDGSVLVVDTRTNAIIDRWVAHKNNSCNTLATSQDGERLLTCSWDKTAKIWNSETHELLTQIDLKAAAYDCDISRDGQLAAFAIGSTVEIWNIENKRQLAVFQRSKDVGFTEVCISPDGKRIAAAGGAEAAEIWNAETGEPIAFSGPSSGNSTTICWSPDNRLIAMAGGGSVCVLNNQTLEIENEYKIVDRSGYHLAFAPDGHRLFIGSDFVSVVDPSQPGVILRFQPADDSIYFLEMSPSGKYLACITTGGFLAICHGDVAN
ncbi:MAG: hypothetical protein R3C03_15185 [Pirellulaceae bacterium]